MPTPARCVTPPPARPAPDRPRPAVPGAARGGPGGLGMGLGLGASSRLGRLGYFARGARLARLALVPALGLALASCAHLQQLSAEVSSFGEWPAGRAPGSYAFDALPSQQAQPETRAAVEAALGPALARAGFTPVQAGQEPDVLVQSGLRVNRSDRSPWDDPLWWPGGFGSWRYGAWRGASWGVSMRWDLATPRYEREVAVLLRDRASGKPLYEARASSEGHGSSARPLLAPLFAAALSDFPAARGQAHRVVVPLGPATSAAPAAP